MVEKYFTTPWNVSNVWPVFNNAGVFSFPAEYRTLSLLSNVRKLFEAIFEKYVIERLEKNRHLSDEQYKIRSARSTADDLTIITHSSSEAQ